MCRKFTLLMALLLPAVMLQAAPVSPELAQSIAWQHLRAHTTRRAAPGREVAPTLVYAAQSAEAVADYYVFNNSSQNGFVVVAGDDRAPGVPGDKYCHKSISQSFRYITQKPPRGGFL